MPAAGCQNPLTACVICPIFDRETAVLRRNNALILVENVLYIEKMTMSDRRYESAPFCGSIIFPRQDVPGL